MASRRKLTSVANGIANAFAHRVNDVDGWWVPGLLLREMRRASPDSSIDLLTGNATPDDLPNGLADLGPAWARYFTWTLGRHGIPSGRVLAARLAFSFDRDVEVYSYLPDKSDHPFSCSVRIEDDHGRIHERTVLGHCSRPEEFTDPNPYGGHAVRQRLTTPAGSSRALGYRRPDPGDMPHAMPWRRLVGSIGRDHP
jgi:hypothetical protein